MKGTGVPWEPPQRGFKRISCFRAQVLGQGMDRPGLGGPIPGRLTAYGMEMVLPLRFRPECRKNMGPHRAWHLLEPLASSNCHHRGEQRVMD